MRAIVATRHLGNPIDYAAPVEAYWNLNVGGWSIRQRGKVVAHVERLELHSCAFVINRRLQQRFAQNNKRRTVHAWIKGFLQKHAAETLSGVTVRYNPFELQQFCEATTLTPVKGAERVLLHTNRRVEALGIETDVIANAVHQLTV